MSDVLMTSVEGAVAVLTLNRPGARNAISSTLRSALDDAIAGLQHDENVRAIVLTGTDPAFCAGVDVKELSARADIARSIGPRLSPVIESAKPLIAAVNGAAYTGGLELALACHWIIASDRASFADTHARLGLAAGWGMTVLLAEAVGTRRARQLSTTCTPIDVHTALTWGLANEIVPHDRLLPRAIEVATAVANNDPRAVQTALRTYGLQRHDADQKLWRREAAEWIDPSELPHELNR